MVGIVASFDELCTSIIQQIFLGFLTTANDVMPANVGLKDQLFALEWVQENIGQFGGNKSRVTIAGESAGSMAAGLHLLGPWENNKSRSNFNIFDL